MFYMYEFFKMSAFHPIHGLNIKVSFDGSSAQIQKFGSENAVIFSRKVLKEEEPFSFKINKVGKVM